MAHDPRARHTDREPAPVAVAVGWPCFGSAPSSPAGARPCCRLKRKISRIQYPPAGMGRDVANSVGMTQRPATMEELLQYCAALEQQNAQLKAQLQRLHEELVLARKHRYGRSSEGGGPHCQDTKSKVSKLQSLLSDRDMRLWWIDMHRAPCPV